MRRTRLGTLASLLLVASSAFAQTSSQSNSNSVAFKTLFNFNDTGNGSYIHGIASDSGGNLYGVAFAGDKSGYGDLFKLTRRASGYSFQVLQDMSIAGGNCNTTPTVDRAGNVFGVCTAPGSKGTLWEYSSQGSFSILHTFAGEDGQEPEDAVALDSSGNIYGTTYIGGPGPGGTLWQYSPASGAFTVLHGFPDGNDGELLVAGPKLDPTTNTLWGTTEYGPNCTFCGNGTVWSYDLTTGTFTTVVDFDNTSIRDPQSSLVMDAGGNLLGTAFGLGKYNCGLVYRLQKNNNYTPFILHTFTGSLLSGDGCYPLAKVSLDSQGNIFGTTYYGGTGAGTVYELHLVNGAWQETILHTFSSSDGGGPDGGLITDGQGNWFGSTNLGGAYEWGTVFEISGVE